MEILKVFGIGARVLIGEDIPGLVAGINIRASGHISYQVAWWDGRNRKEEWLEEIEVRSEKDLKSAKIGFKQ